MSKESIIKENISLNEKVLALKERIASLDEKVEKQSIKLDDYESKQKRLEQENNKLQKENDEQRKKIQHLEERVKTLDIFMKNESSDKLEFEIVKKQLEHDLTKLKRRNRDLEEENDELRHERDQLLSEHKAMIESRDKFKQAQAKLEAGYEARAALQMSGFAELRKNLIEHLNDMHLWKGYLEQDREFESDIIASLTEKAIIDSSYEDQLDYLRNALNSENNKLHQLVKDKEREANEAKTGGAGKDEDQLSPRM